MSATSEKIDNNEDPRYTTRGAVHVPAGEGPTTWFSGDTYTIKASRESTNGSLGLVEATVPPGGGPIAHAHSKTDEAFYVLSGELEILDGGHTFIAGPRRLRLHPARHPAPLHEHGRARREAAVSVHTRR
jgi:mannose-6-phosphate isomerase-like protein (cupin superfamily)